MAANECNPGRRWGGFFLVLALLGLAALAIWFSASVWAAIDVDMPAAGWAALAIGVTLSLGIGCGLMALVFISARHGHDEHIGGA